MQISRSSIMTKIILSTLPILLGAVIVSTIIHKMASQKDDELERAVAMTDAVNHAELEMVKMSEALRGYLLSPENTQEFDRKKAADEGYAKNAKKLSELSKDFTEIVELNEKMAKYDETDLDRIENEVGELIVFRLTFLDWLISHNRTA